MNIFVDENIAAQIVKRLREDGHNVRYTVQGQGIADNVVLDTANKEQALLLTDDKDFGELVIRHRQGTSGVILVRLAGLPNARRAEIVAQVIREHGNQLINCLTVITPLSTRIRPLES